MLDISTRPLAQASVKSVGRVQILDHSPVWRVQFSSPRNKLKIKIKHDFIPYFGKKIPKHKLTISTLKSFVFQRQGTYHIRLNNRRFHGRRRHLGSGANAAKFTVNVWEKS